MTQPAAWQWASSGLSMWEESAQHVQAAVNAFNVHVSPAAQHLPPQADPLSGPAWEHCWVNNWHGTWTLVVTY